MKAGIYLIKDTFNEKKYLVALNGISPFIRIDNAICLSEFANGKNIKDESIISEILKNPDRFEFNAVSAEVAKLHEEPVDISTPKFTDEEYERFIKKEFILPTGDLDKVMVTAEIQAVLHIDWDDATKVFTIVNNRFKENEKWSRMQQYIETVVK